MTASTTSIVAFLTLLVILATANNGFIEYLVVSTFKHYGWPEQPVLYISFVTAFLLCLAVQANLLTVLVPTATEPLAYWVGLAITAAAVARGSNYIADNWGPLLGGAPLSAPPGELKEWAPPADSTGSLR